jgi:hypothetical protein
MAEGEVAMALSRLRKAAKDLNIKVEITSGAGSELSLSAAAALATTYKVRIAMDTTTANNLRDGNYTLYGFKAVKTTAQGGLPTVWFTSLEYSVKTSLTWQVQYQAYTSKSQVQSGVTIDAGFITDIDLGETLFIDKPTGTGTVKNDKPGIIGINNQTTTPFTAGVSQPASGGGDAQPMCAFPMPGKQKLAIVPIEKVLLMFATDTVDTGTVLARSLTEGVMIDLTGAPQQTRDVAYVWNKGWNWGDFPWAFSTQPDTDLAPLLIDNSALRLAESLLVEGSF